MHTSSFPPTAPDSGQRQERSPAPHIAQPKFGPIRWIQQNTFAPYWFPVPLRRSLIGYLVAIVVELGALSLSLLILSLFPTFQFSPIFTLAGVVLIALGWGAGPSLLATLVSTLLLDYFVLPPHFSWVISDPADVVGLLLYLLVGISISLLAGQSERARRQAEEISRLLALAEAGSRSEAERTRESLAALVAMAEAMVQIRPRTPALEDVGDAAALADADTPLPVVARRLAELTQYVLGCQRVSIAALDAATGQVHPVIEVGMSPDQEQLWWSSWFPLQRVEERYGHEIAATLTAGTFSPIDTRHLPESPWRTFFGAQSGRILPMQLGGELVGILVMGYDEPDSDFSADELLLTKTLARLGALVLEQDRLLRGWTEARASELALSETKTQMDTFLGIASHELKTPLTSLKLSLQVAKRRLHKLAEGHGGGAGGGDDALESAVSPINRTEHQVEQMERLVNDLVDVSRIQAGKLELRPDRTDLAAIVCNAVELLQQAAPTRIIQFQTGTDLSIPIFADAGRIEQVVTNYLTNALKYSPADRPVDIGVELEPGQARVWVRDQGPGLPETELEHIWERFHRVKGVEVQSGTGVGLGLGLYISHMIVERHHGQVGVESAPGKGSTFWFTLPVPSPEDESRQERDVLGDRSSI